MNIEAAIKNLNAMKKNYDQRDKKSIPIQTIDMAIEALEKQIPKEPIKLKAMTYKRCPVCKNNVENLYCPSCGQNIDWEELTVWTLGGCLYLPGDGES